MPVVREEIPEDYAAIRNLNRLAFSGNEEAELVDRLRNTRLVVISLVAIEDGEIVGHILFSELPIEAANGAIDGVSLAPMAVHPRYQRQGIGSALVRKGLETCRERGKSIVVVLGHPGYYPRFGFSAPLAAKRRSDSSCPRVSAAADYPRLGGKRECEVAPAAESHRSALHGQGRNLQVHRPEGID